MVRKATKSSGRAAMDYRKLKWDKSGLLPTIVQDNDTGTVLMLAYMNRESLRLTSRTGYMHYWSRERKKLWKKGEESGNVQKVVSLCYDCDADTVLARVKQTGVACHTGSYSCFSSVGDVSTKASGKDILNALADVFEDRKRHPSGSSYVCKLLADETAMLKKLGEESAEVMLACKDGKKDAIVYESADLMFHLLLVMFKYGISLEDIRKELEKRRKPDAKKRKVLPLEVEQSR
jgi:phosphoribosyl-ATP pyrophosphohydrolase/phosphoribosyl-AMP cyclohydrolase